MFMTWGASDSLLLTNKLKNIGMLSVVRCPFRCPYSLFIIHIIHYYYRQCVLYIWAVYTYTCIVAIVFRVSTLASYGVVVIIGVANTAALVAMFDACSANSAARFAVSRVRTDYIDASLLFYMS